MIIASGGDGTLSAAAEALVATKIPLGIIPRGTANALARALGIPDTLEAACQVILDGCVRVVDTVQCNGKHMVLLVGIGFEAETVARADRATKNRWGRLAYLLTGLQQFRWMKWFKARVETEHQVVTVDAAAATVANAAPPTSLLAQGLATVVPDDGMLDVTIVTSNSKSGTIAAAFHLLRTALWGTPSERSDIVYLRARSAKIMAKPPQKVVMDGELIGTTPVEFESIPASLTLLVPELVTKEFER